MALLWVQQALHGLTCAVGETSLVEFAHVELEANDGEHEDGEKEQQPDLQERDHGLHDGLEHHLQTWAEQRKQAGQEHSGQSRKRAAAWTEQPEPGWAGLRVLGQAWSNERSRGQRTELGPPSGGQTGSGGEAGRNSECLHGVELSVLEVGDKAQGSYGEVD